MPANTAPIYSLTPNIGLGSAITAAAADYTGVSVNYQLNYTAGANGSYVERMRLKAVGTNVAAVARIFINNGADHTVATNNTFYGEITLPATTGVTNAGTIDVDYPLGFPLPAGYKIYVGLGAAVASGWTPTTLGGDY